jgi:transposase-like protein
MIRRVHTPEFKAKVTLEAFRERKTTSEIAQTYSVHPNQITKWKGHAMTNFPRIFSTEKTLAEKTQEGLVERLYQEIGRLNVELEWLKKNLYPCA